MGVDQIVSGSTFTWLDHSEQQRRRMLEVIDLFREKGTLDELGFGSIRDAFSDHFFPGTSTLHTRARYLLFVPWVHQRIERDKLPYAQVDTRARREQALIARALQKGGEGEAQGVIGIQAGESLQRTPAVIYWTAFRRFGIWRFPGTLAQYYAALQRPGAHPGSVRSDDGELVDRSGLRGWHSGLPSEPARLFESATFALTTEEAEYLRERILTEVPNTLLALALEGSTRISRIEFPWLHPDRASFPPQLQRELDQAHRFAIVSYGAAILYNLIAAEKAAEAELPIAQGLVERYRQEFASWADAVTTHGSFVRRWNLNDLWETVMGRGHRITYGTRQFVESWVGIVQDDVHAAADHAGARRMLQQRELLLKGGLARLTHRRALERFSGSAGLYQQTYRWPNARRIVGDIHAGLRAGRAGTEANAGT